MLEARLANQKLVASTLTRAADVVAWLGAVQSQDYYGAKWGLGVRACGLTDAEVDRAFDAGEILRTHVLRPTWHFVAPADIKWMLMLTGPRVQAMNRVYARANGLTERDLTRGRVEVERALDGGRNLTRAEIGEVLGRARMAATGQRLAHLVMEFELVGAVCSGPRRGKHFTYGLLADRAPRSRTLTREEALVELPRRYFRSHGPATAKDFAWWSGLTMRDVKIAIEASKVEVLSEPPASDHAPRATYLLPNYDEYLIAYKDRAAVIDPTRVRNLGVFTSVEYPHHLIVDGRVAGSWKRVIGPGSVKIHITSYAKLTRTQAGDVERAAKRYAAFLDVPCEVHW